MSLNVVPRFHRMCATSLKPGVKHNSSNRLRARAQRLQVGVGLNERGQSVGHGGPSVCLELSWSVA